MKRAEFALLTAICLDLVGFSMAFPDISIRLRLMLDKDGVSAGWIGVFTGLVLASLFLTQFVISPRWGALSDRIGRKPVVILCTVLSALSMVAYALTTSPWGVLLSRVLAGFAAANVVVAQAYLADHSSEADRPAAMGRIGAAISVGLISGPAIGGWLADAGGSRLLGFVAAGFSTVGVLLLLMLPNDRPSEASNPGKRPIFDLRLLREIPAIRRLFVLAVVAWFALACLEGTFIPLLAGKFSYPQSFLGIHFASARGIGGSIFAFESLLGFVIQGFLLGYASKRLSTFALLRLGYLLQGVGLILTPFAPVLGILIFCSAIFSTGQSLANPTVSAACSVLTTPERQGEVFGLLQGARSLGFLIGPMLGGALFDLRPYAPYLLAGAVGVVAAALVPAPKRRDVVVE